MTFQERVQKRLFVPVLVGTLFAQIASCAHLVVAYSWANEVPMAWILAVVTVVLSAVFLALAVISPPGRPRKAVMWGTGLLGLVEWTGNFGVGSLLVKAHMPAGIAVLFGLDQGVADRIAAFLFAGFVPVLVFVAVYAIAESASKLLEEPPANVYAEQVLQTRGEDWTAIRPGEPAVVHSNGATSHKEA